MNLQAKVEALATELGKRRAGATGDEAARLQALEQRLVGGGGRGPSTGSGQAGGRGATGSGVVTVQPVRSRLSGLINAFVGSGARTGTMTAPTGTMRATLAEVKQDLAAIEKEIR